MNHVAKSPNLLKQKIVFFFFERCLKLSGKIVPTKNARCKIQRDNTISYGMKTDKESERGPGGLKVRRNERQRWSAIVRRKNGGEGDVGMRRKQVERYGETKKKRKKKKRKTEPVRDGTAGE